MVMSYSSGAEQNPPFGALQGPVDHFSQKKVNSLSPNIFAILLIKPAHIRSENIEALVGTFSLTLCRIPLRTFDDTVKAG